MIVDDRVPASTALPPFSSASLAGRRTAPSAIGSTTESTSSLTCTASSSASTALSFFCAVPLVSRAHRRVNLVATATTNAELAPVRMGQMYGLMEFTLLACRRLRCTIYSRHLAHVGHLLWLLEHDDFWVVVIVFSVGGSGTRICNMFDLDLFIICRSARMTQAVPVPVGIVSRCMFGAFPPKP